MLIADFYSKPLQGKLFQIFRDIILNIGDTTIEDYLEKASREKYGAIKEVSVLPIIIKQATPQECVEQNVKLTKISRSGIEDSGKGKIEKVGNGMTYAQCVRRTMKLHKVARK